MHLLEDAERGVRSVTSWAQSTLSAGLKSVH